MKQKLLALQRPSVILHAADGENLSPAASKIGGKPALPAGFVWPGYEGKNWLDEVARRPMSFLTQINLADVAALDGENLLPHEGMLTFFYELDSQEWGYDPAHAGCARVCYFPDASALTERELPADLEEEFRIDEQSLSFSAENSLPGCEEAQRILGEDIDWDSLTAAREEAGIPEATALNELLGPHRLLGYPNTIQSDLFPQCAQMAGGEASDWLLLLQLGTLSADGEELMWGDCGKIYFCIRRQDLLERNFDNIWLILQCG